MPVSNAPRTRTVLVAFVSWSARRISFALGVLSPHLSLSLPHKGGGNCVAHTFAIHERAPAGRLPEVNEVNSPTSRPISPWRVRSRLAPVLAIMSENDGAVA